MTLKNRQPRHIYQAKQAEMLGHTKPAFLAGIRILKENGLVAMVVCMWSIDRLGWLLE